MESVQHPRRPAPPDLRGELIYNQTRRRNPDGTLTYATRPESEWVRFDRPELRIVSVEAWTAAHTRLASSRAHVTATGGGRPGRRRRNIESAYLLSGFVRCAMCGGSVGVLDRRQYGCITFHKRGATVCGNAVKKPIAALDAAILKQLRTDVLRPTAIMAIIDGLLRRFASPTQARDLTRNRQALAAVDRKIANLTRAIAEGGPLTPLLDALKREQARREDLTVTIATREAIDVTQIDRRTIERTVRQSLADWQAKLTGRAVEETRRALREILVGPLTLTPEGGTYRFEGELLVGALLRGSVDLQPLVRARQDLNLRPPV